MLYSAFGLSLAANRPIPGLMPLSATSPPDIRIWVDEPAASSDDSAVEEPYYVSGSDDGVPALQVWRAANRRYFRLRYWDDTEFVVAGTGSTVWAHSPQASTLEDVATYLLGPVIGFAMRLRGTACLHASVVAVGDHAIAIAGPAGSGKSTAAAGFAAMGHPVLADDIAALVEHDGVLHVQPAYPQLRLWPDSVTMLYGDPDALPRLTPTWDKRALVLSAPGAFQPQPLPLSAVYVLDQQGDRPDTAFEDVSGAERLRLLLANTYVGYLLDASMRQQEFEWLVRLAATVRVRKVNGRARTGSGDVAAICRDLRGDCEGLHV